MNQNTQVITGLDAFAEQFHSQAVASNGPITKDAVVISLALGFQSALKLPAGSILFQWRQDTRAIDLWVQPLELVVEVNYHNPLVLKKNLTPHFYGGLLGAFNNLAHTRAKDRLVVFVTYDAGIAYITRRCAKLLPLVVNKTQRIEPADIVGLPSMVATSALAAGPWMGLSTTLLWRRESATWYLFGWSVQLSQSSGAG